MDVYLINNSWTIRILFCIFRKHILNIKCMYKYIYIRVQGLSHNFIHYKGLLSTKVLLREERSFLFLDVRAISEMVLENFLKASHESEDITHNLMMN